MIFPPTTFSLGRWGLSVNLIALACLLGVLGFCFTPSAPEPAPADMIWASLMFGAVLIIAFLWYLVKARFEYDGPMMYVRKDV